MDRNQNQAALCSINAAYAATSDPATQLNLHRAYYLHQIVEALLSENTDSLVTLAHHG